MKDEHTQHLAVTYLGGPTILIEIGGFRLMTDPTLDPAGANIILNERITEKKLSGPAALPPEHVDVILLSHDQHFDNLDNLGRAFLKEAGVTLTTKAGADRLKGNAIGLDPTEYRTYTAPNGDDIRIIATPARHGPAGVEKLTGEVIGFHITAFGKDKFEIYITGDTVFYSEIARISGLIKPQYVFVFAGAARPRGPFNLTMNTNDAIDTADAFPHATLIPLHSEGWTHYTEHNEDLIEAFNILGIGDRLRILEPGLRTLLPIY